MLVICLQYPRHSDLNFLITKLMQPESDQIDNIHIEELVPLSRLFGLGDLLQDLDSSYFFTLSRNNRVKQDQLLLVYNDHARIVLCRIQI